MSETAPARAAAIVLAAGLSSRMGFDKLAADLGGEPVLGRAIEAFDSCPAIDAIVVVASESAWTQVHELAARRNWAKLARVCRGGARRQDSVAAGLREVGDADVVAIHDGARALVRHHLIAEGVVLAREHGAAVPVVPLVDTIKLVAGEAIVETLDRSRLRAAQTPQTFRLELIRAAHAAVAEDATDDAAMVERLGHPVVAYPGESRNFKITTPDDLALARWLFERGFIA